jgi:hypothetical protein
MLLACTFLRRFPHVMFQHNFKQLDTGQRNMAFMLWIQVDTVMADMEDKVAVEVNEPVVEVEEELTLMALMFWTHLTMLQMMNGISLDMKVAVMLFRLAVIVRIMRVEAMVNKKDICMEDAVVIQDMVAITMLEL